MEKITSKDKVRALILSLIGIFLYFVPVSGAKVPVVVIVDIIKKVFGSAMQYVVVGSILFFLITSLIAKFTENKFCQSLHKGDGNSKLFFYVASSFVCLASWFKLPPAFIFEDARIGGEVFGLAQTVILTVAVCGGFVVFILKSGVVEFVGTLLEPLMKPLFKMPGQAAVNFLSSYVVSAAVGVYISDNYYQEKVYTTRQAVAAATCFSTISIGYISVLCSMANVPEMYSLLLLTTFVLGFVMTIIMVRIPPISKIADTYVDGSSTTMHEFDNKGMTRLELAIYNAALKSREFTFKTAMDSFINAGKFSVKIIASMTTIVVVTLSLLYLTPLFDYLGKPFIPILNLVGMPDANRIAPAIVLGFLNISLPAITVSTGVAVKSIFFTLMLSILQIIFMTESGNAMLGSKIPFSFARLVVIFIIRTMVAIPILAVLSHILF